MKPSFRQKFQYRFDNLMSRGTPAMVGMLFLLSLIIVFIAGVIIALAGFRQVGSDPLPFGETALGYRIETEANDAGKAYGVHPNPKKSERVIYGPSDKVIVIAET